MAVRKAVVLKANGAHEELPPGDTLAGVPPRLADWTFTAFQPGLGVAGGTLGVIGLPHAPVLPAGLAGSGGIALTAAAAQTDIKLMLLHGGAQSLVATYRWAAAALAPTVIPAATLPVPVDGDALLLLQPAAADTALADFSVWLLGSKI